MNDRFLSLQLFVRVAKTGIRSVASREMGKLCRSCGQRLLPRFVHALAEALDQPQRAR
jgi:hypothetical protein